MNRLKTSITIIAATLATASPLLAQHERLSPHETVSKVIDENRVTIVYGRPYTKKPGTAEVRKIWGGLVPFGKVWRTGADEATLFITQKEIAFGDTKIPAGAYTLFTQPEENGSAKLIFSKQIGQWGEQYDGSQDFARVDLTKESLDKPADQFTITIEKGASGGGVLKLAWENTAYSAGFTVKK